MKYINSRESPQFIINIDIINKPTVTNNVFTFKLFFDIAFQVVSTVKAKTNAKITNTAGPIRMLPKSKDNKFNKPPSGEYPVKLT